MNRRRSFSYRIKQLWTTDTQTITIDAFSVVTRLKLNFQCIYLLAVKFVIRIVLCKHYSFIAEQRIMLIKSLKWQFQKHVVAVTKTGPRVSKLHHQITVLDASALNIFTLN